MHLAPLIHDLAVILGVAGIVTLIFQRIRQPVVLGYIIAGVIVGPHMAPRPMVSDLEGIKIWAELGIIFLMFSLGLEFSFRKLARVGPSAGITALFEVGGMLLLGTFTGRALGWAPNESVFLGAMVAISSTTIILKALDELGLKTRRFAEMIFAVLIVEDLVAILLLVVLGTIGANQAFAGATLMNAVGKLVLVVSGWILVGYFVVPRFVRYVGRTGSNETLMNVALGLCLVLVVFAARFEYSVALGAFIMGSILAESSESHRIEERIEPLRDVFAAVFFVSVGMLIDPRAIWANFGQVLLISGVVMGGKILGVTTGALITGQTLRMSMQVGFGLAQIGEFSFILATLGLTLGVLRPSTYPIIVAVSVLTTFTTPYLVRVSHRAAVALENRLPLRWRQLMNRYAAWAQERKADPAQRHEFYRRLGRWVVNGLVAAVIFVGLGEWLGATAGDWTGATPWVVQLSLCLVSLVASSPFLWGMFQAFQGYRMGRPELRTDQRSAPAGGTALLFRLGTAVWLGVLSSEYFALRHAAALTVALILLLGLVFYRQLESTYGWFERRFLSTFEEQPKSRRHSDLLKTLAPWDAHLVRLKVHPNSEYVARKIAESGLRDRQSLNIVAIQRGLKSIVAPRADEMILPKDELLVLGTDEQVEGVRAAIERPPGLEDRFKPVSDYELRMVQIGESSELAGRTLRESAFRDRFDATVVGVERGLDRRVNPPSDFLLRPGDRLWLVGETAKLNLLEGFVQPEAAPS